MAVHQLRSSRLMKIRHFQESDYDDVYRLYRNQTTALPFHHNVRRDQFKMDRIRSSSHAIFRTVGDHIAMGIPDPVADLVKPHRPIFPCSWI